MTDSVLRVTVIGPAHPYKGGAAHHTTELAHRLKQGGHQATIESWRAQYPKVLYPGQLTVAEPEMALFTPTRRHLSWRSPLGWVRCGLRLRNDDVVVMQCHSVVQYIPYLAILLGLRRGDARAVLIVNNVLPHESRAFDRVVARALYRRADLLVVHSAEQSERAAELTKTPIRVAELPAHLPSSRQEADQQAELGVRDSLLFFGIVRPYKGLDVLLRALATAKVKPSLVVAGEFWAEIAETEKLINALGIADQVRLRPGYVEGTAIPELLAACDALVLPYRSASGSQNVLLAFEHQRPAIVTDAGDLAAAVTDGVDGIVCRHDDVADLASAIERFYEPGEPERLRGNVKRVDSAPAWARYVDALTKEL